MIDERIQNIKDLMKDLPHLAEYFEDPEQIIEVAGKLSSEAARLAVATVLIKKSAKMKNDFIIQADSLEKSLLETKADIHKLVEQRDEVVEQLAKQRIITSDLTNQIINIKKFLKNANIKKESLDELLIKSREYLLECSCCNAKFNGTMDEIMNVAPCKKCGDKASWGLSQRILV